MNPLLFENFCSLDSFPGGGNLDQHTVIADSCIVVQTNQFATFSNRGFRVVTKASIDFCGHTSGHNFQDFLAEDHTDFIKGFSDNVFNRGILTNQPPRRLQSLINEALIGRDLCRRQNQ